MTAVDLDAARETLRHRQSEVLGHLLRAEVPAGFDPATARLTSRVLLAKRRRAAVRARPLLAAVPDLAGHFATWATTHPARGCGHEDADAFGAWALRHRRLPGDLAGRWRAQEVDLGRRTAAWVRRGGRRVLVLGLGSRYAEVGLWPVVGRSGRGT